MKASDKKIVVDNSDHSFIASFNTAVKMFGEPHIDSNKSLVEWTMETDDGKPFVIFNLDMGEKMRTEGWENELFTEWYIETGSNIKVEISTFFTNSFDNIKRRTLEALDTLTKEYDELSKMVSIKHYRSCGSDWADLRMIRERIKEYTEITPTERTAVEEWEKASK